MNDQQLSQRLSAFECIHTAFGPSDPQFEKLAPVFSLNKVNQSKLVNRVGKRTQRSLNSGSLFCINDMAAI